MVMTRNKAKERKRPPSMKTLGQASGKQVKKDPDSFRIESKALVDIVKETYVSPMESSSKFITSSK